MIYAKNQLKAYVNATDAQRADQYFCPSCSGKVILKRGALKVAHFAHCSHSCAAFSEGETNEHLAGKRLLVRMWQQVTPQVELEAYQADLRQRPDVLCNFTTGQSLALEFQCAPLSISQMIHRSTGYQNAHFKYLWLLGQRHYPQRNLTQQNAQFIRWHKNLGFYLIFLNPVYERFEVLYGIQMADLLPLKYLHFFARSVGQLTAFLHADHHIRYFPLTNAEKEKQREVLAYKIHQHDRQIYPAQNLCYQKRCSFAQKAQWAFSKTYFPPLYRQPAFLWKIFASSVKQDGNFQANKFLNQQNLFSMPFVEIQRFRQQEWENFNQKMRKIAFIPNCRYN